LKHSAPPLALPGARIHGAFARIWKELGLPAITLQRPGTAIRSAIGRMIGRPMRAAP